MLMLVERSSANNLTVSTARAPPGNPATSSAPAAEWNVWVLVNENPGDHVINDPMFTAAGDRLIDGKVWLTASLEISWLRLPPMLRLPHEKRLLKLAEDPSRAVARFGSVLFRDTIDPLVA